jgi:MFS family permease
MGVMLVAAVGYGARDTTRLSFTTELTGDPSGIGTTATLFAVGLAIGGLAGGRVVDRYDSRRVLAIGMLAQGLGSLATAVLLLQGVQDFTPYGAVTLADGVFAGACIPALATTQAAMVPAGARGSAEIISILRLGIGAVIGILIAGATGRPATTLIVIALIMFAVAGPILMITRPVSVPHGVREVTGQLLSTLRDLPVLRRVVIADLVMCLVIPTQFTNLILADRQEPAFVEPALIGGIAGVVVGRLLLTYTGSHGAVRRALLASEGAFVALCFFGVGLVASGLAFASTWTPAVVLFFGGALTAYTQGMLAALVQQQVPDAVRGRLTGAMAAARSLIIAGSAAMLTAVILPLSALGATAFVAVMGLAALLALRGFRGITASQ